LLICTFWELMSPDEHLLLNMNDCINFYCKSICVQTESQWSHPKEFLDTLNLQKIMATLTCSSSVWRLHEHK
jgi:hypothetical protein